jgi:hypothetical protein
MWKEIALERYKKVYREMRQYAAMEEKRSLAQYLGAVRWREKELKSKEAMAEYWAKGEKIIEIAQWKVSML